ncbi:L,D-transpeptidase family protein [Plastoroseomonas arctica]|uniref:L,D-transpeptidase family protein n=1 Tax=Plastoroseomonas arctica TaxID=1509237 RepID=A0AAF1JYN6_9PROT|nr:L,D-transpeptidase family protein [Plastoroseomonas arctica]MBR0655058.1 L,D-transpeptidase family protein [Plastoroseomonas arctica]
MRILRSLAFALALCAPVLLPATVRAQGTTLAAPQAGLAALAARLRALDADGLDPRHYAIPEEALATSDPTLYRAMLANAADAAMVDLLHGRARAIGGRPDIRRDATAHMLEPWRAELASTANPAATLERAALHHPEIAPLRAALAEARAIVARGPAQAIPTEGPHTIEPGSTDARRMPLLRARLAIEEPALAALPAPDPALYDEPLVEAVKRWQAREGYEADGRIGRITLAALNRPLDSRVMQLRANIDMRRGLAAPETHRRIEVNLPHQRLQLLEGSTPVLDMAVIVGRPDRATPLMRVRMNAVQFNPSWGVPERNARQDLLPRFQRDPAGMQARGFRLYGNVDGVRTVVDATTVDWTAMNRNNFPYFIRQDAGDTNALGRIKFIMPNGEDIYMHDTPDRHLFRRPDRAFSSGCIRLERPMEMLDAALSGTPGWDRARAQRVLDSRATSGTAITRTVPVALIYTTAIVRDGGVVLRHDLYNHDATYVRAMDAASTRTRTASR